MRSRLSLLPLFILTLVGTLVSPELVLESGYSVSTVLDFNKPLPSGGLDGTSVRPFSLLPLTRSSNMLILLDSTHSAFYSLQLPLSQESVVRLISGKGTAGFSDGDPTSAMFDRPRSFAVDANDNVYVADRINHVIRKISSSSGLGALPVSIIAVVALLCGLAFGFVVRPFLTLSSSKASMNHWILHLQKHFQSTRSKLLLIFSSGIRSVAASLKTLHLLLRRLTNSCLCYPRVVFRNIRLGKVVHGKEHELLLFADFISSQKLQQIRDERKDFIDFEEESIVLDSSSSTNQQVEMEDSPSSVMNLQGAEDEGNLNGKIDNMMISNLLDFTTQSKQQHVMKRRNGVHDLSY